MSFSFDDAALEIKCPKCGKQIKQTVGWFKKQGVKCPHCGAGFDTTQFASGIEKAEQLTNKTLREMSRTFEIKINL